MTLQQLIESVKTAADKAHAAELLHDSLHDPTPLAEAYSTSSWPFDAAIVILRSIAPAGAVDSWIRAIKGRAEEIRKSQTAEIVTLHPAHLKIAPPFAPPGLESPEGYEITADGITNAGVVISYTPAVVVSTFRDIQSATVSVEVAWLESPIAPHRWTRTIVPKSMITDSRKIGSLADRGLEVGSTNAADLVSYFRAFAAHNRDAIPLRSVSSRCGWVVDASIPSAPNAPNAPNFVRGRVTHGPANIELEASGGLALIADGITTAGDPSRWRDVVEEHAAPRASLLLAIYASMAAPLIEVVNGPGFAVDWSGPSGRGKSTALELAASVWGDPLRLLQGWDASSSVGPSEIASFLHNVPLMMDDTNQVPPQKQNLIAELLYSIPNGHGKLKGSKDGGLREVKSWRTVLMTTGEQPITTYAGGNAGARRRALCVQGAPMGSASEANSRIAREIKNASAESYGFAGAVLCAYLCSTPWEDLKRRHGALTASYEARGVGSTDRSLGAAVALIELASEVAGECGALEIDDGARLAAVALAWSAAVQGGEDSDEPLSALRDLWSWCAANEGRMWQHKGSPRPHAGWAGAWALAGDGETATKWMVRPNVASEVLAAHGRKPDYCVLEWRRRGLLEVVNGSHLIQRRAYKNTRFLVFTDEALGLL